MSRVPRLKSRFWSRDRYVRGASHPLTKFAATQLALIVDPLYCETVKTWKHETNDTHYMSQASANFNLRDTFALEFWFRKGVVTGTPTRCFASRASGATSATTQWVVGSYDSVSGGACSDSICVGMRNAADANYAVARWQFRWTSGSKTGDQINQPPYSHVVIQFNGAGATNADKIKLWINGSQQTFDYFANNFPTMLIDAPAAQLDLGRGRYASYTDAAWTHYLKGASAANSGLSALGLTRIFAQAHHQLTEAEIAILYNSGRPLPHAQLPASFTATQPAMASWEWEGTNGVTDSSGNGYTLTASVPAEVKIGNAVLGVRDAKDNALWTPRNNSSWSSTYAIGSGSNQTALLGLATAQGMNYAAAPELIQAGNAWVLDCKGCQFVARDLSDTFARSDGFHALSALAIQAIASNDVNGEGFGLCAGSKTVQNDYFAMPFTSHRSSVRKWSTRSRSASPLWNWQDVGTDAADTVAADGLWKVVRTTDDGGASVWALHVNGTSYPILAVGGGAAANVAGFADFAPGQLNLAAIHLLPQAGFYSGHGRAYYGSQVVYAGPLNTADLTEAEAYLRSLHGV